MERLDATGPIGSTVEVVLQLDNTGEPLAGWHWGVCHHGASVSIGIGDVTNGRAVAALDFTFHAVNRFPGGWTVGCLTDVVTQEVLEPGEDLEMYIGTYALSETGTAEVEFCETDLVTVRVIVEDLEIEPVQDGAIIEVTSAPAPFRFAAEDRNVPYDPEAPGEVGFAVDLSIEENPDNPGFPSPTVGFDMGIGHDGALLDAVGVEAIGPLATIFGGGPPDFFVVNTAPNMGADDGVIIGVIYDLMGGSSLEFLETAEVLRVDYVVAASP